MVSRPPRASACESNKSRARVLDPPSLLPSSLPHSSVRARLWQKVDATKTFRERRRDIFFLDSARSSAI